MVKLSGSVLMTTTTA